MLLYMHKCSSLIPRPLQVDIRLETRVSQKVGSQANTTTTVCVGHSSFMTLILCAAVIITIVEHYVEHTVCTTNTMFVSVVNILFYCACLIAVHVHVY